MSVHLILNRNADGAAVLHREDCPTIQHQVRGDLREELPGGGFRILESHDDGTALVGPNEDTYRSYFEAHYVSAEELTGASRYRRCKTRAPEAPDGPPPAQLSHKRASSLSAADLGRLSVDGVIERIEHAPFGASVSFVGGTRKTFGSGESVSFPKGRRATGDAIAT